MKTFKAIVDIKGVLFTRLIEAVNIDEATKVARSYGRIVSIKSKFGFNLESPLEKTDRQILMHRLAAMTASRIGLSEALLLIEVNFSGMIQKIASRLLRHIDAGSDLSVAMENVGSKHFPPTTVALIRAGLLAGNTSVALKNAAKFEKEMDEIKKGNSMQFYIAIFYFITAVCVTFGVTRFAWPFIQGLDLMQLNEDSVDSPIFEYLAITSEILMGVMLFIFMALVGLSKVWKKINPVSADKIIVRVPHFKDLVLAKNSYITLYGLHMLLESGVSLEDSLLITAENSERGALQQDLKNAAKFVSAGQPWAKAMSCLHPTDRASLLAAMDRDGEIESLKALSIQYKEVYSARMSSLSQSLTNVSIIFLLLAGCVMFGLTILPMLELMSNGF